MGNQQVNLKKRKLQRLSCDGSTLQAIGSGSGGHRLGDDIVYAHMKV